MPLKESSDIIKKNSRIARRLSVGFFFIIGIICYYISALEIVQAYELIMEEWVYGKNN